MIFFFKSIKIMKLISLAQMDFKNGESLSTGQDTFTYVTQREYGWFHRLEFFSHPYKHNTQYTINGNMTSFLLFSILWGQWICFDKYVLKENKWVVIEFPF